MCYVCQQSTMQNMLFTCMMYEFFGKHNTYVLVSMYTLLTSFHHAENAKNCPALLMHTILVSSAIFQCCYIAILIYWKCYYLKHKNFKNKSEEKYKWKSNGSDADRRPVATITLNKIWNIIRINEHIAMLLDACIYTLEFTLTHFIIRI